MRLRHRVFAWPWPLHPLVAPFPPLLAFVHTNRSMTDWTQATFAVGATWTAELVVLALLVPVLRSVRTAAVVVSLATVLFYSDHLMRGWSGLAWAGIGVLAVGFAIRPRSGEVVTTFANLVAVFGMLLPLNTLYGDETRLRKPRPAPDRFETLPIAASLGDRPDVVYVVLDGYGSAEVLSDRFGYDSPLPAALRARGFSVADDAHSNYIQTALSFAATLNLDYVPNLLVDSSPTDRDRGGLADLIHDNRVVRTFRAAGYRIVEFPGEYAQTRQLAADDSRGPLIAFTEFEHMLVNRTPVQELTACLGLPQSWIPHQLRRNQLRYALDGLAEGDDDPGPTFTFAHLVAPHPPFVFEADGSYRPERARAAFADGGTWWALAEPFGERYADGYIAQVQWLDAELPRVVDGILARSPDAVILIHGDHGPGSGLDLHDLAQTDVPERTGILMAARLPDSAPLPPGITPVNLFRVVFGVLFDADLPLLEDRSWYSTWPTPYAFVDVTDRSKARD